MQIFESSTSDSNPQQSNSVSEFDTLGPDLIELIISLLPFISIIRASSVCKSWYSIIRSSPFKTRISSSNSLPWFFISGQDYFSSVNCPSFAFSPKYEEWIKLPTEIFPYNESFTVSNGFFFTISPKNFCFRPALTSTWEYLPPLSFSTREHLIGVYTDPCLSNLTRFFVIGAAAGDMPVNIYNPFSGLWETCPPPQLSVWQDISNTLSLSLFRDKFYLFAIDAGFTWSFDLQTRSWSNVQKLSPEGIELSYLFTCEDQLVLAGLCRFNRNKPEFNLWRIDETMLEFTKIGCMPEEMLSHFFGSQRERKYERLKCVGSGNVLYVFSRQREGCPACICEISNSGTCSWRRIPNLPGPVPRLWRASFCCTVSVQDIL